jgi:8-hydroxy-5-deazaflavin:NADPH oxidoreductase
VIGMAEQLGMRGIDAGGLESAHTAERITVMLIGMNIAYKKRTLGLTITNL